MTPAEAVWRVGDGRRIAVRNHLVGVGLLALAFMGFALISTQLHGIRVHSPWQDDPYDVVVSFTMFFVPGLVGLALLRVPLCLATRPLPVERTASLIRLANLTAGLVTATAATDAVAVALRVHRQSWDGATASLIVAVCALLVGATLLLVKGITLARFAPFDATVSRFLDDASNVVVTAVSATFGGVVGRRARAACEVVIAGRVGVRHHPLVWAGGCSATAGCSVALGIAAREDGFGVLTVVEAAIFGIVTFAFLLVVNKHVAVVPVQTTRSVRVIVGSATAVALALAFRDVGPGIRTLPVFVALLAAAGLIGGLAGSASLSQRRQSQP